MDGFAPSLAGYLPVTGERLTGMKNSQELKKKGGI